jgi:hypothetical protein
MKYLCLVYSEEEKLHSLPESPEDAECLAYADSLRESGRLVTGEALESVQTATTVRVRGARCLSPMVPSPRRKSNWPGFI